MYAQILWYNSHIKINKKPIFWEKWYASKIVNVMDICDINGKLLSFVEFLNRYPQLAWLDYVSIKEAIPGSWKDTLSMNSGDVDCTKLLYDSLKEVPKKCYQEISIII